MFEILVCCWGFSLQWPKNHPCGDYTTVYTVTTSFHISLNKNICISCCGNDKIKYTCMYIVMMHFILYKLTQNMNNPV